MKVYSTVRGPPDAPCRGLHAVPGQPAKVRCGLRSTLVWGELRSVALAAETDLAAPSFSAFGHLAAGGQGPLKTWSHPLGTSMTVHPFRFMVRLTRTQKNSHKQSHLEPPCCTSNRVFAPTALVHAVPKEVSALRSVTSIANYTPCCRGNPDATTFISRSSVAGTVRFMSPS